MNMSLQAPLRTGFKNEVYDATAIFRAVLNAMSRPARVVDLPIVPETPGTISAGAIAVLLTLADMDTPVWLEENCDSDELRAHLHFHAGCPITNDPGEAAFAVLSVQSDLGVIDQLAIGSAEYPDRSATVIVDCEQITAAAGAVFSGPGIQHQSAFNIHKAPERLWSVVARNAALFPLGIDWIFTSPQTLAALPRTSRIKD